MAVVGIAKHVTVQVSRRLSGGRPRNPGAPEGERRVGDGGRRCSIKARSVRPGPERAAERQVAAHLPVVTLRLARGEMAAVACEDLRPHQGADAAADPLLHLDHSDVLLAVVVGERDLWIDQNGRHQTCFATTRAGSGREDRLGSRVRFDGTFRQPVCRIVFPHAPFVDQAWSGARHRPWIEHFHHRRHRQWHTIGSNPRPGGEPPGGCRWHPVV